MPKKSFAFVLFMLIAINGSAQQNQQGIFDKANHLLKDGKIVQAIDSYQQLAQREQVSGALFINMGYAYLQLGKLGKAKYYYLRAKSFEETQKKAEAGVKYVESQLSHQSVVLPPLPWEKALNWLHATFGAVLLLGMGLILINFGVLILATSWLRKKYSPVIPKITTALAAVGVLIILLSFYIDYRQQRYSKAVMITPQTNVVKQPTREAVMVNKAYEGYSFTVDHKKSRNHNQWVYVRMSNGSWGWIRRQEIMIL